MTVVKQDLPAFRLPSKHELYRLTAWLFTHLICGLMPLWGSWLLLKLGKHTTDLSDYVSHGEFCLYAAGLSGATLFVILGDERHLLRGRLIIGLGAAALLVISALVFAGAFMLNYKAGANISQQMDMPFLAKTSLLLYAGALLMAVATLYLQELGDSYDPREAQRREQNDLTQKFHKIPD